jgi:N-acetylmuramoyl-L-alanine amidase
MPESPARRGAFVAATVAAGLLLTSTPQTAHAQAAQAARPAPAASSQAAANPAIVKTITRTALPRGDRITIEFSREVSYTSDRLANPDRIYFDFSKAVLAAGTMARAQALAGLIVKKARIGQNTETALRLVIELGPGTPRQSAFVLYNPFRVVIDIEQAAPAEPPSPVVKASVTLPIVVVPPAADPAPIVAAPSPAPAAPAGPVLPAVSTDISTVLRNAKPVALTSPAPASSTSRGNYSLARQLGLGVSRIVIDAGHGGHDPGAQANGIDEAELVLDVALRLETLLKAQPGLDVVLTRRTDEFIPLQERTAIANREGADLFLSIHANAAIDPQLRGIETYFLNFASNPTAETVAARENATGAKTMGDLPELVKAITLNNKVAESRELAGMVQSSMTRELADRNKTVRDLGVKQAPFVVLIGAQMPSVLAEISFVTNKGEATLLKQAAYRQDIAQALFDAVTKYQTSLKRPATASGVSKGGD